MAHSGVTPSSVNIIANNGDFNISVVKSNFTNEDIIIEGYNIRSRVSKSELIEGIKKDIESVNLSRAKNNLEIATNKFPKNTEIQELNARYEELKTLNFINSNRKTCAIRLIEESPKEFIVQDGLAPQKNFGIQNKPDFIKDLANSIDNETNVVYLDVRGLGDEKSEAFVTSTNIQIKAYRPDVVVKAAPKDGKFRKLFFEGEVVQKSSDILPIFDEYLGIQTYNVKLEGQTWKIGLGLEVKAYIERAKSKNLIKSFFSLFDKRISKEKGWNLSDAVNSTRKDVQKKYRDIKDEDYDAFIKNELLGINIVFIELIEEDKILISATNDK
ncbi:MAG: hypothetical protein IPN33_06965 [Saprospiraceae bacterium]|nr:hypothetical protein [Saprospiraceae bacterium]